MAVVQLLNVKTNALLQELNVPDLTCSPSEYDGRVFDNDDIQSKPTLEFEVILNAIQELAETISASSSEKGALLARLGSRLQTMLRRMELLDAERKESAERLQSMNERHEAKEMEFARKEKW